MQRFVGTACPDVLNIAAGASRSHLPLPLSHSLVPLRLFHATLDGIENLHCGQSLTNR